MTINKDRTYTTRDGRAVRIYATDAMFHHPIHGAITNQAESKSWDIKSWNSNGQVFSDGEESHQDLIEVLKPNGIPVDLPDPPEVEGYSWEARGWEWSSDGRNLPYGFFFGGGWSDVSDGNHRADGCSDTFYIEYIPNPNPAVEMTLAEAESKLSFITGKTIKIVK